MDSCDVLVVGGGPAGSACASALVAGGMDAVVLDRSPFPRPKVCAGWVTPQVFQTLDLSPEEYGRDRLLQHITGFRTGSWGGRRVETRYGRTVSYGVLRAEFDHCLLVRSGARLRLGEPLESLERVAGAWVANGDLRAPAVVGAGGHRCPVARRLGAGQGLAVAALELELELAPGGCPVDGETPELWFTPDLRGYGWCLRKGARLEVGLGVEGGKGLKGLISRFLAMLAAELGLDFKGDPSWRGHGYRLWGRGPTPLVWDGALLVGDAAGLAHPRSGEGIRPAVESGLLAARAVLAARGDYRAERLGTYEEALRARLGRSGHPSTRDPSACRLAVARLLLGSPLLTRLVLLDRWFLRRRSPALRGP